MACHVDVAGVVHPSAATFSQRKSLDSQKN